MRRQCDDIKRLNYYRPGLCPQVINEYFSQTEYYYDMEYLEGYNTLSSYETKTVYRVVKRLLGDLYDDVYCYYKPLISTDEKIAWIKTFLREKIMPKFEIIESLHPTLRDILNSESVYINGHQYDPVNKLCQYMITISPLTNTLLINAAPEFICPIHGDLTLENIMYNPITDDYKLIDPAGSRYVDAVEMDTAKLLQSLVCEYHTWDDMQNLVSVCPDTGEFTIAPQFLDDKMESLSALLGQVNYEKGLFFMSMYFIRMMPFMYKKSLQHAILALLLATHYLSRT